MALCEINTDISKYIENIDVPDCRSIPRDLRRDEAVSKASNMSFRLKWRNLLMIDKELFIPHQFSPPWSK